MAADNILPGCSKPTREEARLQAREVRRMRLMTRLPAVPYPMNRGKGKRPWTTGNEVQ
jgi:hypothetical protein